MSSSRASTPSSTSSPIGPGPACSSRSGHGPAGSPARARRAARAPRRAALRQLRAEVRILVEHPHRGGERRRLLPGCPVRAHARGNLRPSRSVIGDPAMQHMRRRSFPGEAGTDLPPCSRTIKWNPCLAAVLSEAPAIPDRALASAVYARAARSAIGRRRRPAPPAVSGRTGRAPPRALPSARSRCASSSATRRSASRARERGEDPLVRVERRAPLGRRVVVERAVGLGRVPQQPDQAQRVRLRRARRGSRSGSAGWPPARRRRRRPRPRATQSRRRGGDPRRARRRRASAARGAPPAPRARGAARRSPRRSASRSSVTK